MTSLNSGGTDWKRETYSHFVEYILKSHHGYLKKEMPEIERLVFTIFKVHFFDSGHVLENVHKLFGQLKAELEAHIIKEERSLFYMIKDYEKAPSKELLENIIECIESVEADNRTVEVILKKLRQITDGYMVPTSGCPTFDLTYKKLMEMETDLLKHIDIENTIFTRLREEA